MDSRGLSSQHMSFYHLLHIRSVMAFYLRPAAGSAARLWELAEGAQSSHEPIDEIWCRFEVV